MDLRGALGKARVSAALGAQADSPTGACAHLVASETPDKLGGHEERHPVRLRRVFASPAALLEAPSCYVSDAWARS